MRLLIVNFEMDKNSGVLAWQAGVAAELAKRCEEVVVLTERIGAVELPPNVRVVRIPPRPYGVPRRLGGVWLVNWLVFRLWRQHRFDVCFIHMAMEWAYRLFPCFKVLRIPVLMWYAHGTVSRRLYVAHRCVTRVVTSTPEGFRIPSSKVRVIGQGVATDLFRPQDSNGARHNLITVSRVSRRKRIELLLAVMAVLKGMPQASVLRLQVIGPLLTADDHAYQEELRALALELGVQDRVDFAGFMSQEQIPALYRDAFLHINVSRTGSMDKTVIEALACGCPVLTSNEAFFDTLREYPEFIIRDDRAEAIAKQVLRLYEMGPQYDRERLRSLVVGRHDVQGYADRLLANLQEISKRQRSIDRKPMEA